MPLSKLQRECIDHLVIKAESGLSDKEWADRMRVTDRAMRNWKVLPEFEAALKSAQIAYDETTSVYGQKTYLWSLTEAEKNYKSAKRKGEGTETRHWWKELNALAAPAAETGPRVDYSQWTLESLKDEAYGKRGMDPVSVERDRLREVL